MQTMDERQTQIREQVAEVFRAAALENIPQLDGVLTATFTNGKVGYCAIGLFSAPELWQSRGLLSRAFCAERVYRCPVEGCDRKHFGSMILAHLNNQTPSFNHNCPGHGFDWLTIAKYVPLIEEVV